MSTSTVPPDVSAAAVAATDENMAQAPRPDAPNPIHVGRHTRTATRLLMIGLAELLAILVVRLLFGWNVPLLLLVHAAALTAIILYLRELEAAGDDVSLALLALIAGLATGPVGPIGAGLLATRSAATTDADLLKRWYERISLATTVDPVTRLCDNVAVGRGMNLSAGSPASFLAAIESGSMAERQTILGIVARRFHADYVPALQAALKSPEPAIRVQAAAVAAHVRPEVALLFQSAVAELPQASADPARGLGLMQRLEALAASGLLDESDRRRGVEIVGRLRDVVLSGVRTARLSTRTSLLAANAAEQATLEALLIGANRFTDLRTARSAGLVLARRPAARIRRLGQMSALTARPAPLEAPA